MRGHGRLAPRRVEHHHRASADQAVRRERDQPSRPARLPMRPHQKACSYDATAATAATPTTAAAGDHLMTRSVAITGQHHQARTLWPACMAFWCSRSSDTLMQSSDLRIRLWDRFPEASTRLISAGQVHGVRVGSRSRGGNAPRLLEDPSILRPSVDQLRPRRRPELLPAAPPCAHAGPRRGNTAWESGALLPLSDRVHGRWERLQLLSLLTSANARQISRYPSFPRSLPSGGLCRAS
jgi:hypothetical protein